IRSGGQWLVKGPAHDDRKPSLAMKEGQDGRVLLYCHAGCPESRILAALGLTEADRLPAGREAGPLGGIDAGDDYPGEKRGLLYQVVRYTPKNFRQRRPDGKGGWIWNVEGARRVLYRLPELNGCEEVVICEGEKDVDALWAAGIPATCNVGGAGKWGDDYTAQLKAAGVRRVRVIPDNDVPGRDHTDQATRSCLAAGLDARIVTLPGVPEKGDASDYLAAHPASDLRDLLTAAPIYVRE